MRPAEKAWQDINFYWQVYTHTEPESAAESRLREALKELQVMRVPVAAIDLIGRALRDVERTTLERSFCGKCGSAGVAQVEPIHSDDTSNDGELPRCCECDQQSVGVDEDGTPYCAEHYRARMGRPHFREPVEHHPKPEPTS
jgi:hypothetical protein